MNDEEKIVRTISRLQRELANARMDLVRLTGDNIVSNGFLSLPNQDDAPGAVSNAARVYAEDNGAGKTRIVVRWPSGSFTVLATEP